MNHNTLITIIGPPPWSRRRRHHHLDNRATGINPETFLLFLSFFPLPSRFSLDLMRGKTKCRWVSGNGASATASLKGASRAVYVTSMEWTRFICNSWFERKERAPENVLFLLAVMSHSDTDLDGAPRWEGGREEPREFHPVFGSCLPKQKRRSRDSVMWHPSKLQLRLNFWP